MELYGYDQAMDDIAFLEEGPLRQDELIACAARLRQYIKELTAESRQAKQAGFIQDDGQ
jgi:hypothetical protein